MKINLLKSLALSVLTIFTVLNLDSQTISLYQKTFTSGLGEIGNFAGPTNDGGTIVAGYTNTGAKDALVMKLSENGEPAWAYTYSGTGTQVASIARPTSDGGYIVVGYNSPNDSYIGRDVLLLKLNADGTLDWAKTYGTPNSDQGNDIVVASDGGFAIAGETGKDLSGNGGLLYMKTNSDGIVSSYNQFQDDSGDAGRSIAKTSDGGYIIGADFLGDYVGFMKLTSSGTISWTKACIATDVFGGPSTWQAIQTSDGGYAAAAHIGDPSVSDALVVKLNSSGDVEWLKRLGNPSNTAIEDWAFGIQQYGDELIIPGYTNDGGNHGFVIKMDLDGNLLSSEIVSNTNRFGMYLSPGGNGGFGFATQQGSSLLVAKMNNELATGCSNTDAGLSILGNAYLESNGSTSFISTTSPSPDDPGLSPTPFVPTVTTPCTGVPIEEFSSTEQISVYPNPASDNIFVSFNNIDIEHPVFVSVMNFQGQLILSFNSHNMKTISINTSHYKAGIYSLKIETQNGTFIRKFIQTN